VRVYIIESNQGIDEKKKKMKLMIRISKTELYVCIYKVV
jgi:hypothetical protein